MEEKTFKEVLEIVDRFSITRLKRISSHIEDNPKDALLKSDLKILTNLAFIQAGKETLTEKEIKEEIGAILVLCTLEVFRREGYLQRDKFGRYKDTKVGKLLRKYIKKSTKK